MIELEIPPSRSTGSTPVDLSGLPETGDVLLKLPDSVVPIITFWHAGFRARANDWQLMHT